MWLCILMVSTLVIVVMHTYGEYTGNFSYVLHVCFRVSTLVIEVMHAYGECTGNFGYVLHACFMVSTLVIVVMHAYGECTGNFGYVLHVCFRVSTLIIVVTFYMCALWCVHCYFSHLTVNTQTLIFHTSWWIHEQLPQAFTPCGKNAHPGFSHLVMNTVTAAIIFHLMVCVLILIFHTSWSIHWPLPLSSISWYVYLSLFFTPHGQYTDHCHYLPSHGMCTYPYFSHLMVNTLTTAIIFHLMVCVLILIFHTSWSIHWPLPLSSIPHGEYTGPHFSHLMVNTLTTATVFYTSWWVHRSSLFTPHGQNTDHCHCLLYLMVSTQVLTFHTSWSIHWPLPLSSIPHGEYTGPHFSHLMVNTLTAATVFYTSWWVHRSSLFTPHGQYTDHCRCLLYLMVSTQVLTFHTSWSIHWPLPLSSIPQGEYREPHFSHLMVNTLSAAGIFHTSRWVPRSSIFTPHGQYTECCWYLPYFMVSTQVLTFHTSWSIHWPLLVSSILHGEYTDPNFSPLTHTDRCHCLPYLTVSAQILSDRCCYGPYYSSDITIVVDWA